MEFAIGGIAVAALVVGIVEAAKEFGVGGKKSRALALGTGVVLVGVSQAIARGLVPAEAVVWVELVITAVAGGVAAMGYYDFAKRFMKG